MAERVKPTTNGRPKPTPQTPVKAESPKPSAEADDEDEAEDEAEDGEEAANEGSETDDEGDQGDAEGDDEPEAETEDAKADEPKRPVLDSPRPFGIHVKGLVVHFKKGKNLLEAMPFVTGGHGTVKELLKAIKSESYVRDNGAEIIYR